MGVQLLLPKSIDKLTDREKVVPELAEGVLELGTRREVRDFASLDSDLLAGLRVDTLSSLPLADREGAKANKSDRVALLELLLDDTRESFKGAF